MTRGGFAWLCLCSSAALKSCAADRSGGWCWLPYFVYGGDWRRRRRGEGAGGGKQKGKSVSERERERERKENTGSSSLMHRRSGE